VDRIWLNMDRPNNLKVIDRLIFLEGPVDWDRVRAVLHERLVRRFRVFGQRPVPAVVPWALPHWEDDPDFSLERHLHRVRLPRPGNDAALRRHVEARLRQPLDRRHPLWEADLIDGYRAGSVVFVRFHHAISDGIALAHVLMSLTDATPDGETEPAADGALPLPALTGPATRLAGTIRGLATNATSAACGFAVAVPRWVRPARVGDLAVQAWRTAGIVNKLLLGHNPATSFAGEPGVEKTVVWSRPFPLADIKQIGRLAGATVNDVLVSALAGAIASYLEERDGVATDLTTMVPVNVRRLDRPLPSDLGNQFALVFVKLPSGVTAPLARLAETKRRMDSIKHSPEALLTFGLIGVIGRTAKEIERFLVSFFAAKAIGVTTNVMGPPGPRFLAGTKIASVLAWVPSSGRQTLGVCIFTYNDAVRVGFKVDATTVPDPEQLVKAFDRQIRSLHRMARGLT